MKIALVQPQVKIGDFEGNFQKITSHIEKASAEGADLVVFPELAVCGYPPEDLLSYRGFVDQALNKISGIAEWCHDIAAIVGGVSRSGNKGAGLYNSAFFLRNGQVEKVIAKRLLPWYDVFDEYRYFDPAGSDQSPVVELSGRRLLITICEDIWDAELTNYYSESYVNELANYSGDAIINIAASPFSKEQVGRRENVLEKVSGKTEKPVIFVNQLGAHADLIFDGGSMVYEPELGVVVQAERFQEALQCYDFDKKHQAYNSSPSKEALLHDALVFGTAEFFRKNNFPGAILGLSGGIDSALGYYLACRALGAENVTPVMLPTRYTSDLSLEGSRKLVENMGGKLEEVSVDEVFEGYLSALHPLFGETDGGVAEENIQARARGVVLMALSNKWGQVLLNTTNKSEMAVGYGTLYGDLCGALSVIGDLFKEDVYRLCEFINANEELIPRKIIDRPPTAELKHDQKDEDSLPPYEKLDKILYHYVNRGISPNEIIKKGFEPSMVHEVVKRVENNEFKRYQSPPVLRVSDKAFGRGRRIPLVARFNF